MHKKRPVPYKGRSHLEAGLKRTWKKIETWVSIRGNTVIISRCNKPLSLGPSSVQPDVAAVPYASQPAAAADSSMNAPGTHVQCTNDSW